MSALADVRWSWTVESFERAVAAGAFGPEAQVELFEGEVHASTACRSCFGTCSRVTEWRYARMHENNHQSA